MDNYRAESDTSASRPDIDPKAAVTPQSHRGIICPICGEIAVQEKCKVICRSEKCRGRIVMNCSEF